jgi:hypothetical protein
VLELLDELVSPMLHSLREFQSDENANAAEIVSTHTLILGSLGSSGL